MYQSSWIYQFQSSSSAVPTVLSSGCNNPVESTSFRAISEQLQSSSNCILFWMQSSSWNCQFQGSSRAIPIRLICGSNQIESTKIQLNLPVSEQFQNSSRAVPTVLFSGYSNPVESPSFRAVPEHFQCSSNQIDSWIQQSGWIYHLQSSSSPAPTRLYSLCSNPVESASFRTVPEQSQWTLIFYEPVNIRNSSGVAQHQSQCTSRAVKITSIVHSWSNSFPV